MNTDFSAVRGSGHLYPESLYLGITGLSWATPAPEIADKEKWVARQEQGHTMPQERSRQRRQRKDQRRRDVARSRSCHLARLPNELLLMVMHHMDKESLKSFVLTNKRMHHVREGNAIAVFKGMQREQFPGYLSVFGDPVERSDEQAEEMQIVARGSHFWEHSPRPPYDDLRTLWWQHFTDLTILEQNLHSETAALRSLAGGDTFDGALSKDAIFLQWRLGLRMDRPTEEDGQQMFPNHPAEVRHQLLKIGQFLVAKIEDHVGLAAIAGCWARLEVHLPKVGSFEETRFMEWISARVTAHTLAVVLRHGPRGIAELLSYAKNSAELSQLRFNFVQLLVNDQAEAGTGDFDTEMMMSQTVGFDALTFAKTTQKLEDLLKFWRGQLTDDHMGYLKRFLGIQD